ncbi:MAG: LysM domain-containing protein [Eubacteriales bacterium]|nr:LysM domain-containing protein [Eubacteriales bacterium]
MTEKNILNEEELEQVTGGKRHAPYVSYTVRTGDTLSAIAVKYRTSVKRIQELNSISNPDCIKVNQELLVEDNRPQE